ncbi:glycoside hydrolase family 25 protein [Aquimarina longa]|uniref:glycoside hydrolase family 25 protein n=1 Tax=Aquimarina longa TaxID=1080221 RepID=UPI0007861375|nr:GH25 family lysozyme [Aquimarina longa]
MRIFNEREIHFINALITHKEKVPLSLNELLQKKFFTAANKRALIIQVQEQYAMYFLSPEVFENDTAKKNEIGCFMELLSLIHYLNNQGYITIYRDQHKLEKPLYYLNNEFNDPKVEHGKLILNPEGLYSSKPEEIKNKSEEVVYKGIEFKNENFHFIFNTVIGKVYISKKIEKLLEVDKKKDKIHIPVLSIINTILLLGLLISGWFIYNKVVSNLEDSTTDFHQRLDNIKLNINAAKTSDPIGSNKKVTIPTKKVRYGIDISRWNGNILSRQKLPDSIGFIICKATEGIDEIDPMFKKNWKKIKELKLIRGAYHFYVIDKEPIQQAEHFWSQINDIDSFDIAPIVDIERASAIEDASIDKIDLQVNVLLFLKRLKELSGIQPMIYSGYSFANRYLTSTKFSKYDLWLAEYTNSSTPEIPSVWKEKGCRIWQKSDTYSLESSKLDLDVFYIE